MASFDPYDYHCSYCGQPAGSPCLTTMTDNLPPGNKVDPHWPRVRAATVWNPSHSDYIPPRGTEPRPLDPALADEPCLDLGEDINTTAPLERHRQLAATTSDQTWQFLAGLYYARGSAYIGCANRAGSSRYSPGLSVEVPEPLPDLDALLGSPTERRYFGRTAYRYAVQSRERIIIVASHLIDMLPESHAERLQLLVNFCRYPDPARYRAFIEGTVRDD